MAAAAAIVSSKKKKRPHSFETNPSIRKRQQNRLLRKLRVGIFGLIMCIVSCSVCQDILQMFYFCSKQSKSLPPGLVNKLLFWLLHLESQTLVLNALVQSPWKMWLVFEYKLSLFNRVDTCPIKHGKARDFFFKTVVFLVILCYIHIILS